MFTGIIEEVGVIGRVERHVPAGLPRTGREALDLSIRIVILAKAVLEDLKVGDSLSVDGVCLTTAQLSATEIMLDVSPQTLRVSTLGDAKVGDGVNLERAMRLGDRLGGHWVSGHADGVGCIRERQVGGDSCVLRIEAPPEVLRYCVKKGSIAVDGVSLTIHDLTEKDLTATIIPHTAKATTLGLKGVMARVNLESDIIGKYVERLVCREEASQPKIDVEYLRKHRLI